MTEFLLSDREIKNSFFLVDIKVIKTKVQECRQRSLCGWNYYK
jgi:hypothetical protein